VLASYVQSEIDGVQYFNIGMGRIQANALGQFIVNPARMIVEPRKTDHRGMSLKVLHNLKLGKTEHKISVGYRDNKDTNYGYAYYDSRVFANVATVIADSTGPKKVSFPGAPRSVFSLNDPFATTITGVASATNPNPVPVTSAYVTDYVTLMGGRLNLLAGAHYINIKSQSKTATSPQFGAVFELTKGYNLYALTSNSYRPNGPASTVNPALGFTDPEKGSGKEIGLKFNQFDGKLTGTLSAYKITRENIVQFLGGVFTQNNNIPSGEELSQGLELDLVHTPSPGLSIMAAYAYTDAYVSKNLIAPTGFDSPDENRDGIADIIGLRKEGVAKNDIRLWLSYDFDKNSPLRGLSFGGGYTWRQGPIQQFPTYIQRFVQQVADPVRVDLFASYKTKLAGRATSVRVNWQNATNANYRDRRGYFVQPSAAAASSGSSLPPPQLAAAPFLKSNPNPPCALHYFASLVAFSDSRLSPSFQPSPGVRFSPKAPPMAGSLAASTIPPPKHSSAMPRFASMARAYSPPPATAATIPLPTSPSARPPCRFPTRATQNPPSRSRSQRAKPPRAILNSPLRVPRNPAPTMARFSSGRSSSHRRSKAMRSKS
jgi:hypothetical protein